MSLSGPLAVVRRLRRGAGRLRGLVLVAMLAAIAVTATAVWVAARGAGSPAGDTATGSVVRVGVSDGASIPAYEQSSRAELAALVAGGRTDEMVALVTLGSYATPDQLAPVLSGVALSQVYARVPAPGLQTQIVRLDAYRVPADVTAGMDQVAARKDAEAADYARLIAGLGSTDKERDLRAVYTSGRQIATVEAAAYRSHCACVYAAVVRAAPAALDRLAHRDGVRVVDPAPQVRQLDRAVFLPPLPEQRELAIPLDNSGQSTASPAA